MIFNVSNWSMGLLMDQIQFGNEFLFLRRSPSRDRKYIPMFSKKTGETERILWLAPSLPFYIISSGQGAYC